ncbi:MAG: IclR family transcriptional regulator [Anaerolineales bacterium]|nr:IclR family transcriptional regulator [Anaerolineales bacterium]
MRSLDLDELTGQGVETIKMVDRALTVLDMLRLTRKGLGVNQIAKQCGFSPSTTFRILKTLEFNGWVFQCSDGCYIAGEKLSFVVEKNNLYLALKEVAAFVMERYTTTHNQAMNLTVREGVRCYILQQSRTKNLVDYVPPLYSDLPYYASAGGKILLCELPSSLVEEIIRAREMHSLTQNTITDADLFRQELRTVAEQGYAIDNKESAENGSCIAVPVRDCEGNIIAALSFSGFVGIADRTELLRYIPALQEAATEISRSLYRCWGR